MKTMCLREDRRALVEWEVPVPLPAAGEVLVRVHAAGVTPTEMEWYPTTHTKTGEPRRNAVPGHEFSGVVKAPGEGVTGFREGEEVYGFNDWFSDGATADYCLTSPAMIASKPRRLSHIEAASIPIGALTAWQGLHTHARLQAGERVLIHGGAGAVGVFAIQMAKQAGAHIITTASARNREFLRELGAEMVIDYHSERFEEHSGDFDVVFDGVGGETLRRSWAVLKPGGRMVTIAADGENAEGEREKAAFFIVEANQDQLREIAAQIDQGALQTFVDVVVPLHEASTAYFGKIPQRNGYGKTVIAVIG